MWKGGEKKPHVHKKRTSKEMIGVKCIFKIYFYLRITKQNKKVVHFPLLYIEIEQVIFKPEMLYCINFVLIITR